MGRSLAQAVSPTYIQTELTLEGIGSEHSAVVKDIGSKMEELWDPGELSAFSELQFSHLQNWDKNTVCVRGLLGGFNDLFMLSIHV